MDYSRSGFPFRGNRNNPFSQEDWVAHIRKLTDEVQEALQHLPVQRSGTASTVQSDLPLQCAKRLERERQQRLQYFPENLVRDPAWPLLLELYRCRAETIELSVTGLSHATNIPSATGHRWIDELKRAGMVTLSPSLTDARCTIVTMTNEAFKKMDHYLRVIC
ncbi:MarR family winged helix-turn-helix transcriptional regulator [Sphingobium boeckii]|uniref:DNA-binding MarR family transcriptional regulator n=1 Tax=Sphingobium boeckii TaxID=1082345 RepID=A0A7W9AGW7_9SPHN|nr:MarR family winged helix-turn-helix transcriptional regulator [Sphingobium boeckii]MBB5685493.1 DNA-binding MarR family transcriptional regulator [Sphingobium boeckii]